MKKILFSLLLWAGFAIANTCTEAVFKLSKGSLSIKNGEAYHDSSYFMENYYKEIQPYLKKNPILTENLEVTL